MKINSLIDLRNEMIDKTKIHFAIGTKEKYEPLYAFYRDDFKYWQETQNKKKLQPK